VFGCVMIVSDRQKVLEWQAPLMYRQILHELMKQMSLSIFVTSLQYRWVLNNVCLILLKTRQITAN
jgi:hypothetical protein